MAENYSRYGDIDQLLEEVLLAPSKHRTLTQPAVGINRDDVYCQVDKKAPLSGADKVDQAKSNASSNAAFDDIEYQLERLRRVAGTSTDAAGNECQSYEVLERVSSFRVHPPLPLPPTNKLETDTGNKQASKSNQQPSVFPISDAEDENVEYATEVTALRPIGKGIHTLKAYSRIRQSQAHQQQQQQPDRLHQFPQWQRNRLHQSTPSLQPNPSDAESSNLSALRAATLRASSTALQHEKIQSIQPPRQLEDSSAEAKAASEERSDRGLSDGILESVKTACCQWYQPMLSRNDASNRLITQPAGSFLMRRSANHPGSFDLVVRAPETASASNRPIRHLLVERRYFANVAYFAIAGDPVSDVSSSLSDLIAANIRPASVSKQLPCPLRMPPPPPPPRPVLATSTEIDCSALYLAAVDVETATGASAIARATEALMRCRHRLQPRQCQLLASAKPRPGIRVVFADGTDEEKYIPAACVLHCGYDPCQRSFDSDEAVDIGVNRPRIFGFVLRNRSDCLDNCVLLACDHLDDKRTSALVQAVRAWLGL